MNYNPNCGRCGHLNMRGYCNLTACLYPKIKTESHPYIKLTNSYKIRNMTDRELSHFLFSIQCAPISRPKEWIEWLEKDMEGKL